MVIRARSGRKPPVWPNGLRIGFHLSIAGGPEVLFERFHARGCGAFQIFVGSPRVWKTTPWKAENVEGLRKLRRDAGDPPLVVHSRYLINLTSVNPEVRRRSCEVLEWEFSEAARLGADLFVLHMGSNAERTRGLHLMAENLVAAVRGIAKQKPLLLLENTAGERNDLGSRLEDIARVRERLPFPSGVCFDTCHAFQAGFDLASPEGRAAVVGSATSLLGPDGIRLVHLNDSKNPLGGRHDRHEDIGQGRIGAENLADFLLFPSFEGLPVILETPQAGAEDPGPDLRNLGRLRRAFSEAKKLPPR